MVIKSIIILVSCFFLYSCALGTFGLNNADVNNPDVIMGKTKQEIISILGIPEKKIVIGDTEYWSYIQQQNVYFFVFGNIFEKEIVLHFNNDIVSDVEEIKIGEIGSLIIVPGVITR
jgi:outer membrane protein assembly factor BamE (lipoprotein component of BamABCDE complex)